MCGDQPLNGNGATSSQMGDKESRPQSRSRDDAPGITDSEIEKAAQILAGGKVVAFTGAGVSAESGVPTYRDPGGLWRKFDMKKVSHINSFLKNPVACWRFELELLRLLKTVTPNAGHFALAELEAAGVLTGIVTQNVEALHAIAGSKNVIELHGNETRALCLRCGKTCPALAAFRSIGWINEAGDIVEHALPDVSMILREDCGRAKDSSSSPSPPPILRKPAPAVPKANSKTASTEQFSGTAVGNKSERMKPQPQPGSLLDSSGGGARKGDEQNTELAATPVAGAPCIAMDASPAPVPAVVPAMLSEAAQPKITPAAMPMQKPAAKATAAGKAASRSTSSSSVSSVSSSSSSSSSDPVPRGDNSPLAPPGAPTCPSCGIGLLKPDAIYFGERLVTSTLREAERLFRHGKVALIIGSTCKVAPANVLPVRLKRQGGKLVDINPQGSRLSPLADVWLRGRSAEVLPRLARAVMAIRAEKAANRDDSEGTKAAK